jgi:hypothetical protein
VPHEWISVHDDWLSLIEISGPFLAVPVLKEAFPQGLEELDAIKRKRSAPSLRGMARSAGDWTIRNSPICTVAWIDEVLSRGLELDEDGRGDVLKRADWCSRNLHVSTARAWRDAVARLAVVDEQRETSR